MRLHYRVDGEGERALILSGSLGTTLELWAPQIAPLASEFCVIRYDHPGHGCSPLPAPGATAEDLADAVLRLLDKLGVQRFSFCGLSLGGVVGMALALRDGGRLEQLVLCSTAARIATPEHWANRATLVRQDGIEPVADTLVARWFTPRYAAAEPAAVQRYRAMLAETPAEGYARCCDVLCRSDLRDSLGAIAVPTLVLRGDEDPVISPDDAAELEGGIRHSCLVVLSPAAHLANVERSGEFNRALRAHLGAEVAA